MKFTTILAFIAAATVVSASTNAERMARGLPPKMPAKRATRAHRARHSMPSSAPECSTGTVHCCDSVQKAGKNKDCDDLLDTLGLSPKTGTPVGVNCSPLSLIGSAPNSCNAQTVCCEHNNWNGLVNLGCTPVNINA